MIMGTNNSESCYTQALMSLIVDFVAEHPEIAPARLYIGGCSNGGYMTISPFGKQRGDAEDGV